MFMGFFFINKIRDRYTSHHLSKAISLLVSRLLIFLRLLRFAVASFGLFLNEALPKTNISESANSSYLLWLCLCLQIWSRPSCTPLVAVINHPLYAAHDGQ